MDASNILSELAFSLGDSIYQAIKESVPSETLELVDIHDALNIAALTKSTDDLAAAITKAAQLLATQAPSTL